MKKRILAILLTVAIVLSCASILIVAAEETDIAAKIGEKEYPTFGAAYEAAQSGETITLLTPVVVAKGETLTLDKKVTITYTSNVPGEDMLTNRGTVIVDGATLVYVNTDTTASNVTVSTISCEPGSLLEVKSGVVQNDSANNGALGIYAFAIDLLTNGSLGDVTVSVSGGQVISTNYMAIRQFNNGTACKNSLTVTGGYICGGTRAIQVHLKNSAAYTTISGGKIEAGGYALCLFPTDAVNLFVTGGNFIGTIYSGTNGFITGGSFDEAVYDGYVAEGHGLTYANGVYTVAENKSNDSASENTATESQGGFAGGITDEQKDTLENNNITPDTIHTAVNSNTQTNANLEQAAQNIVKNDNYTASDAAAAISNAFGTTVEAADVKIEYRPYLNVQAKEYKEETVENKTVKTVTLEISAKYDIVAVTNDGSRAASLESVPMEVTDQPISITVPVPAGFVAEGEYVYVKHIKDSENTYDYKATYDAATSTITFTTYHGFSEFQVYTSTVKVPAYEDRKFTYSMTLNSTMDMNFYIPVEVAGENPTFVATIGGENVAVSVTKVAHEDWKDGRWRVRYSFNADQMMQQITVKCLNGNEVIAEKTMSVQAYLMEVLEYYETNNTNPDAAKWCAMSVSVLEYGSMAQIISGNPTNLPNAQLTSEQKKYLSEYDWPQG